MTVSLKVKLTLAAPLAVDKRLQRLPSSYYVMFQRARAFLNAIHLSIIYDDDIKEWDVIPLLTKVSVNRPNFNVRLALSLYCG